MLIIAWQLGPPILLGLIPTIHMRITYSSSQILLLHILAMRRSSPQEPAVKEEPLLVSISGVAAGRVSSQRSTFKAPCMRASG